MIVFGLSPGAQVIMLQGLSTYAALLSAYFFARPVLKSQALDAHRELLSNLRSTTSGVNELIAEASDRLAERARKDRPFHRADNARGVIMLAASFFLFTMAVILQMSTDPAFVAENPAKAHDVKPH